MAKYFPDVELLQIGKRTYQMSDLVELYKRVQARSRELNLGILKSPRAPRYLGADLAPTKLVEKEIALLNQIELSGVVPKGVRVDKAIQKLENYANNPGRLQRAFYSEVAKYYGVTRGQAARLAPKGRLKSPVNPSLTYSEPSSSYDRYKRWTYTTLENVHVPRIMAIKNVKELNDISQHWERSGRMRTLKYYSYAGSYDPDNLRGKR